jgi:hypothetical protein
MPLHSQLAAALFHHLIVQPLGYAEEVDGCPAVLMLHHSAVFDGQGNALHKALEYVVHVVNGAGASFLHILRDVMHIRGTDRQVIDELWRYRKLPCISTTPHALDSSQQCVQLWNGVVGKRLRLLLRYEIEKKSPFLCVAEVEYRCVIYGSSNHTVFSAASVPARARVCHR